MRPRVLRRNLALAGIGAVLAGATIGTGIARADGVITNVEAAYIAAYGATAVCPTIDAFPDASVAAAVMEGSHDDGFTYANAVDIINVSVQEYCPRHWPLLQAIGAKARGELKGRYLA